MDHYLSGEGCPEWSGRSGSLSATRCRLTTSWSISSTNTSGRRGYARACDRFFGWCERRGLALMTIRPFDVAAWVCEATHAGDGFIY